MKSMTFLVGAVVVALMVGCSTTPPVVLGPVGPNPDRLASTAWNGELQVFSSLAEQSDDQNQGNNGDPVWFQHTDYNIYALDGTLVKHVDNSIGHYDQAPRRLTLAPGRYLVKAEASDYLHVEVPVTIQSGKLTRIHLDDNWQLPPETQKAKLVKLPDGKPVGWRAGSVQ